MRQIIVTGALGHIGSRLIRELPSAFPEAEIVMVDDLSTQRYASLFDLPPDGRYRFLQTDILKADLNAIFSESDVVLHLAAATDAAGSVHIPERVREINLMGTRKVARACVEAGSPLIFLSTTSVYGVSSSLVDETCEELRPQSPYAHSKLDAESVLAEFGQAHELDFVICRFGTIFGVSPGMRFHTAINKFVWQACFDMPITVWRTALHQHRPYLALEDATSAILFLLQNRVFNREIYNVVTANATVFEVVESIRAHIPSIQIEFVDSPIMNQLSYRVSTDKFRSLGFSFAGSLPGGILETIRLLRGDLNGRHSALSRFDQFNVTAR